MIDKALDIIQAVLTMAIQLCFLSIFIIIICGIIRKVITWALTKEQ